MASRAAAQERGTKPSAVETVLPAAPRGIVRHTRVTGYGACLADRSRRNRSGHAKSPGLVPSVRAPGIDRVPRGVDHQMPVMDPRHAGTHAFIGGFLAGAIEHVPMIQLAAVFEHVDRA